MSQMSQKVPYLEVDKTPKKEEPDFKEYIAI